MNINGGDAENYTIIYPITKPEIIDLNTFNNSDKIIYKHLKILIVENY